MAATGHGPRGSAQGEQALAPPPHEDGAQHDDDDLSGWPPRKDASSMEERSAAYSGRWTKARAIPSMPSNFCSVTMAVNATKAASDASAPASRTRPRTAFVESAHM
jgi:hypothetical protein